jgi:hypothetical protein
MSKMHEQNKRRLFPGIEGVDIDTYVRAARRERSEAFRQLFGFSSADKGEASAKPVPGRLHGGLKVA